MVNLNLIKHTFSFAGLNILKSFFTKAHLIDYIGKSSVFSFLYTKHIIKTGLYFVLFLLLPKTRTYFLNEIKNLFTNYNNHNVLNVIIAIFILAIIEISQAFPLYFGLSSSKLSSFIASSTVMTIIGNVLLGFIIFKENIEPQVILGLLLSIIGLYLILHSNGDK